MLPKSMIALACAICTFTLPATDQNTTNKQKPNSSNDVRLVVKQYAPEELNDEIFPNYSKAAPGYSIIMISLDGINDAKNLKGEIKRPLVEQFRDRAKKVYRKRNKEFINWLTDLSFSKYDLDQLKTFAVGGEGYMPGEQMKCKIMSSSGKVYLQETYIPTPIHVQNPSGLGIDVVLKDMINTRYEINVKGLQKDVKYTFKSVSENERMEAPLNKDTHISYEPGVTGKDGGLATISVESSEEKVSLTLPWGIELSKYLDGGIIYTPDGPKNAPKHEALKYASPKIK